jgi:hypothetical protein
LSDELRDAWTRKRRTEAEIMTPPVGTADALSDDLQAGAAALAECNWRVARAAFERATAAGGGPEAFEGLAQAAFFLDDAAVTIDARERAYAGYREAGRPVDAGRVAIALAWDYRAFRGERAVADGWLARARRLLAGCGRTRERGWLALREASVRPAGGCGARTRALRGSRAAGS